MQLIYHQATYDLLTRTYIDPQPAIDNFEQYSASFTYNHHIQKGADEETARRKEEYWRQQVLAWTRLDLHKRPVTFSDENIEKLNALEAKHGVNIPASVREWYSLDIAPDILSASPSPYSPIIMAIEKIGPMSKDRLWGNEYREDLWYFIQAEYVEQGGEPILFQVGAGDDPPVYAALYGEYRLLFDTFSQFLYLSYWNWTTQYMFPYSFYLYPHRLFQIPEPYWFDIQRCEQMFSRLPVGKSPHYYDEHTRINPSLPTEYTGNEVVTLDTGKYGGGHFAADSIDTLRHLIRLIWGDFAPVFFNLSWEPETVKLFEEIQREQMRLFFQTTSGWVEDAELLSFFHVDKPGHINNVRKAVYWLVEQNELIPHPDNSQEDPAQNRFQWQPR